MATAQGFNKSRIQGFGSDGSKKVWQCPQGHMLQPWTAKPGACDGCGRKVNKGDKVMDCRTCNWYLCDTCHPQEIYGFTDGIWSTLTSVFDAAATEMSELTSEISSSVEAAASFMTCSAPEMKDLEATEIEVPAAAESSRRRRRGSLPAAKKVSSESTGTAAPTTTPSAESATATPAAEGASDGAEGKKEAAAAPASAPPAAAATAAPPADLLDLGQPDLLDFGEPEKAEAPAEPAPAAPAEAAAASSKVGDGGEDKEATASTAPDTTAMPGEGDLMGLFDAVAAAPAPAPAAPVPAAVAPPPSGAPAVVDGGLLFDPAPAAPAPAAPAPATVAPPPAAQDSLLIDLM